MLSDDLKQTIQQSYRTFLQQHDLKPRYGQKMMIAAVARTLGGISFDDKKERTSENHLCVIEAGTGTGKTMAYLLSAIPIAKARGKSLVISTATVALQEQLINKDLPEAAKLVDGYVSYVLAKGRGRYFCISQAEKLLISQDELGQMALYEDEVDQKLDADVIALYRQLLDRFAAGEWDGDRDSLEQELDEPLWYPLTSDHTRCTNRRCSNFSVCPFYKSRDTMDKADIVVANHDLVLADLSLGGGAILPEPENSIYIFDEAHHLASKAIGHFSYSMWIKATQKWLKGSEKQLNQLLDETDHHPVITNYLEKMAQPGVDMMSFLDGFNTTLNLMLVDGQESVPERFRFPQGLIPEKLSETARQMAFATEKWMLKAEQILDVLKEALDGGVPEISKDVAERWYPRVGQMWLRSQAIYALNKSYATPDPEGSAPTARWISLRESLDGRDFDCQSSPVSAAATLQENLWKHAFGAVLTSATMTALGRFDRIIDELGLPADVTCERLPSPFDYQQRATLMIPPMSSDPGKSDEHQEEVSRFLNKTLPEARATLVLFSSWRQMYAVLEALPERLKGFVLAQGDLTKNEIIRQHKLRVDDDAPSIIFGLASFAEGVDLPGDYLTEVIITKLPFSVPDDPVDATMSEWIEQSGGNAFMEWTVPETSVRLTQAVGRLLRTEQDSGRVVLLDRRVVTRRYGRQLLDSLPPFRREIG